MWQAVAIWTGLLCLWFAISHYKKQSAKKGQTSQPYWPNQVPQPARPQPSTIQRAPSQTQAVPTISAKSYAKVLAEWIEDACLDKSVLAPMSGPLHQACINGESRSLDRLLRTLVPTEMWEWPGYYAWAKRVEQKPTRIRMVAAAANMLQSRVTQQIRLAQMLENDRYPFWQMRAVGGPGDCPDCAQHDGRIELSSSDFWRSHGPVVCRNIGCTCSVRAYNERDMQDKKLVLGIPQNLETDGRG